MFENDGILAKNSRKYSAELDWHQKAYEKRGGRRSHGWYERHFTQGFGLEKSFFNRKRLLDIGCGPLGSLEWADNSLLRVGIDPLANHYMSLGASEHEMTMVVGGGESIPFPDNYFDVVSSFNNIDHVDDLNKVVAEIKRVCKHGGTFLLITDIHTVPTTCEPHCIGWNFEEQFLDAFEVVEKHELEKSEPTNMYVSVENKVPFNHSNPRSRYGILKCRMIKKS